MSEWKEYRLGDVCEVFGRIGFRGYTTKDLVETQEEGAISLSPSNIIQGELELSKCTFIKWDKYEESPEIKIQKGDIIFVKTGSSYGRSALVRSVEHPMTLNPQLVVLKNIIVNPIILSYVIKGREFQGGVNGIIGGSAIPTLSQKRLADLMVKLPSRKIQDKISEILLSIDSKIENNRKISANLGAQAQALFKHWFIDFAPFKDGKFVESELGMIPEGWRVGTLGEIADITMGQSPSGSSYNEDGNGSIFYQGKTDFGFRFPSIRLFTTEPKRYAEPLSTLLSVRAPVGDINVATVKCCIGRGLASIKSKYNHHSFIYYLLKSKKRIFDVYNGEGTVFGSINKETLNGLSLVVPPVSVVKAFNDLVEGLDCMILENNNENLRLSTLRDTLLPKLMSGAIKV